MNRRSMLLALLAMVACAGHDGSSMAAETADGRKFLGAWRGTWAGDGTGQFEFELEPADDGAVGGRVLVGADTGEYTARFATLTFSGSRMLGRYDYPYDDAEIVIEGAFGAATAAGVWKLVAKSGNQVLLSGTWTVQKD